MLNNRSTRTAIAAAMMAAFTLPALAQNIGSVNGKPVPVSREEMLTAQIVKSGRPITPEIRGQIRDEVIAREVFLQEAQKQGLEGTQDYRDQMELARQTILIRDLFTKWQEKNPISDADAKAEYDKFASANGTKEYKAHHILVDKEADAKDIIARLKKGAKFEDIAKKQSKDTGSGANGGELDWASPNSYVPEFTAGLTALKKGQITETPVKSQFGYHVIRLDDTRESKLPPFDQVKPQIVQQLQQQRLAKYQEDLRTNAKVEMPKS